MRAKRLRRGLAWVLAGVGAVASAVVLAGKADVLQVRVEPAGADAYRFSVTVRHADEGWDHYADRWEVLAPDGTVLGVRTLHHPHVEEQPFTRSLSGVTVPAGIERVRVRARDSRHGWGGEERTIELPPAD